MHAHTYRRLDPRDVTVRDGIPVTTVPRTLVDLSDVLTPHQLANVIHEAAFRKLFDERAVRAAMTTGQRPPQPPRARTRRLSSTRPAARAPRASSPNLNLVVEVDGPGHTRPRIKREDKERDVRLRAAGQTVLRVLDHEIDHRPDTVASSLLSAARPA